MQALRLVLWSMRAAVPHLSFQVHLCMCIRSLPMFIPHSNISPQQLHHRRRIPHHGNLALLLHVLAVKEP